LGDLTFQFVQVYLHSVEGDGRPFAWCGLLLLALGGP
jgi:hypothetical protein